jgi:hypothetical protein
VGTGILSANASSGIYEKTEIQVEFNRPGFRINYGSVTGARIFSCRYRRSGAEAEKQIKPPMHGTAISIKQNEEEASCRAFVQNFYNWYLNQLADKAENVGRTMDDDLIHILTR